jgi:signal transduction histidine kinase
VRTIVEGILEFARSGARPSSGSADVAEVLDGVLAELAPEAEGARVQLHVPPFERASSPAEIRRGAPRAVRLTSPERVKVATSPGVLTSVVSNLVRNAIKYMGDSPTRSISVCVLARRRSVLFEVCDTGPGVKPELHGYIFEPYARVDGTGVPGIGLGLATVKRFVTAHGGSVGVRSPASPETGAGAVFWFDLPRA